MRIMALDPGEKLIGIAVSDELEITANPRGALRRDGNELEALVGLAAAEEVGEIVVGLPISMNGVEGSGAEKSRALVASLAERLTIPVRSWDERLSTRMVERTMLEGDLRRSRRRKIVDQMAAAVILESYLRYRELSGLGDAE